MDAWKACEQNFLGQERFKYESIGSFGISLGQRLCAREEFVKFKFLDLWV